MSNKLAKLQIGTHNGKFHADELVACAMLRVLPEYANAEIVRTRNSTELSLCTVVVDVGGTFDATTHRYDHHQRFKDFFPDSKWNIKLSSAGLIYVHFGQRVLAKLANVQESDPMIPIIFRKPRFMDALSMVDKELRSFIHYYVDSWYPARDIVAKAMQERFKFHPSGHLVIFENKSCPWGSHIHELEKLEFETKQEYLPFDLSNPVSLERRPIYVIYHRDDGTWSVQSVGLSELDSFKQRLPLLAQWRGLRDEELSTAVGIPDCIFVHATGFLGIHKSREGALHLALYSLQSAGLLDSF